MALEFRVIAVTDDAGALVEPTWLQKTEGVHRQLRPQLPVNYATRLSEVFANGGRLAVVVEGASVVGVCLLYTSRCV